MNLMKEETRKSNTHQVTKFDQHKYCLSFQETIDHNEGRLEKNLRSTNKMGGATA